MEVRVPLALLAAPISLLDLGRHDRGLDRPDGTACLSIPPSTVAEDSGDSMKIRSITHATTSSSATSHDFFTSIKPGAAFS